MAILCFIYVLVFIKKLKNKQILKNLIFNLIIIVLGTSFFWMGMIQHYFATSYEVFVPGRMEVGNKLERYKTEFYQLFITKKDTPMVYAIGLVTVIGLILTPIAWKKIDKTYKKTFVIFLIFGIILTFMTLTFFPFEKLPSIFRMIQFTFRLFEFTSFFFAIVAGINYGLVIKNFKLTDITILLIISLLLLTPYKSKIEYKIEKNEQDLIDGVRVTEHTGRIHAGMASMEYLPSKAFKVLNTYIATREDVPIVMEGQEQITISNYKKNGTNMYFELTGLEADTKIELPYIYYLGYKIYVNEEKVEYSESENGFVLINVTKNMCKEDNTIIRVKYTGTSAMLITMIISCVSIVLLIIITKKNWKNRKVAT